MDEQDPKKCACGCGGSIDPKPHHKYQPQRFIRGHHKGRQYTPKPEEIPNGLCECGCGTNTQLAKVTLRKWRHFAGHPTPYVHGHGRRERGERHHLWKGGRVFRKDGYVDAYCPSHPDSDVKGYVREHRLVMDLVLGRRLTRDEHVHHINHIKHDNRPENLMLMTKQEHMAEHHKDRRAGRDRRMAADPLWLRKAGLKGAAARWGDYVLDRRKLQPTFQRILEKYGRLR